VPFENGTGKTEDLRRRGLLFLAAGEMTKAEEYFNKSREAGPSEPVTRYLDRIASQKSEERELTAMVTWKKAEEFYENRSWDAAKHAYEIMLRDYVGTAVMDANMKVLKNHMDVVADQRSFYLSDMAETEVRVGHGKFGRKGDLGYLNGRIDVCGKFSPHGLSMHPGTKTSSHVTYILNKAFSAFRATVALNDDVGRCASPLIFKVRGDGKELWVSNPIASSKAPQDVQCDLNGVTKLELEIQCRGDDSFAHAVWAEPRVEKN
jgi:tetratricopeptide (TPR) repeat protein